MGCRGVWGAVSAKKEADTVVSFSEYIYFSYISLLLSHAEKIINMRRVPYFYL